jgi:hypothetical protein
MKKFLKTVTFLTIAFAFVFLAFSNNAFAEDAPRPAIFPEVSPVSQRLSLDPGSSGSYEVKVKNIGSEAFSFRVYASPYSVSGENYDLSFETQTNRTQISRWISFEQETYTVEVGEAAIVKYTVSVPEDVPAGSQYAAVFVELLPSDAGDDSKGGIKAISRIAVVVYGSIAGDTREIAEIKEIKLPFFMTRGKLTASTLVRNDGNTDFPARTSLKVSSLFGKLLFEKEETRDVLPDTERRIEITWNETPSFGIFRGEYKVSTNTGETKTKNRLIFIIPVFVVVFAVLLLTSIIILAIIAWRKRRSKKINSKI